MFDVYLLLLLSSSAVEKQIKVFATVDKYIKSATI